MNFLVGIGVADINLLVDNGLILGKQIDCVNIGYFSQGKKFHTWFWEFIMLLRNLCKTISILKAIIKIREMNLN